MKTKKKKTKKTKSILCYKPHFDRHDQYFPNEGYNPHVHVPRIDYAARIVVIIWEDKNWEDR